MRKRRGLYTALVEIPDHLYPFKVKVGGRYVRGIRAYNARLAWYEKKYGLGHYGIPLEAYRQLFHLAGSILYLILSAYLSSRFFSGTRAMQVFLIFAVAFITFQEFYLHRRLYQQLWRKGILDWISWCVPIGLYLLWYPQ